MKSVYRSFGYAMAGIFGWEEQTPEKRGKAQKKGASNKQPQ